MKHRMLIPRLVCSLIVLCIITNCSYDPAPDQLTTPITFSGEIPCADCPGNLITVTFRSDSLFLMRQVYREAIDGMDKAFLERGRWTQHPETGHLLLTGGEFRQKYVIVDDQHIRMLDQFGQPIESDLNYALARSPNVDLFSDTLRMTGRYMYFADAGWYWDCRFETGFPVAQQGDNAILEAAYAQAAAEPRDTVLIVFDGHLDSLPAVDRDGMEERIVVDRLRGIWPEMNCESPTPPITLEYTVWDVIGLDKQVVLVDQGQSQPYLRIIPADNAVVGHTGCNRFRGELKYGAERIAMSPTAITKMACPSGVTLESRLLAALDAVTAFSHQGDTLFLRDDTDERVRLVARR
ncbi:MAG: META domain-containing protein [candidate division Zixibacteria bacterium]|nr:META domain-containing protein [candidate division Zixibacteria bacterium]